MWSNKVTREVTHGICEASCNNRKVESCSQYFAIFIVAIKIKAILHEWYLCKIDEYTLAWKVVIEI